MRGAVKGKTFYDRLVWDILSLAVPFYFISIMLVGISYFNLKIFTVTIGLACLVLIAASPFTGFIMYLSLLILDDDFPIRGPVAMNSGEFSSFFSTGFGLSSVSTTLLMVLLLRVLMIPKSRATQGEYGEDWFDKRMRWYAIGFIPFLLLAYRNLSDGLTYIIMDIYPFFYFFSFYLVCRKILTTEKMLMTAQRVVISAITAKTLVVLTFYLIEFGTPFESGIIKYTFDSGIRFYPFMLFFMLMAFSQGIARRFPLKAILLVLLLISALATFVLVSARFLIITTAVGLFFLPKKALSLKLKIASAAVVVSLFFFVLAVSPDVGQAIMDRIAKLFAPIESTKTGEINSSSQAIRVIEGINVYLTLKDKGLLLLGLGPGSWFDDRHFPYPFPVGEFDYSTMELSTRKFRKPHFPWVITFMKQGILGVALNIFIFYSAIKLLLIRASKSKDRLLTTYYYAIYGTYFTLFAAYISQKIFMVMAFMMAVAAFNRFKDKDVASTSPPD